MNNFPSQEDGDHAAKKPPKKRRAKRKVEKPTSLEDLGHPCVVQSPTTPPPILSLGLGAGEKDPNGKGQHDAGAKLDHGKPRVHLVLGAFRFALIEVARVGTVGAEKYSDHGWLSVPNGIERYTDAMYRHLLCEPGSLDKDTGLDHAAHAAWNALAVLELKLRNEG